MEQFGGGVRGRKGAVPRCAGLFQLFQHIMYHTDNGAVGTVGIASAFQYAGVAAFQAEREHVELTLGTCFVDDADYSEGDAHPLYFQSVGHYSLFCTRPTGEGNLATLRISVAIPFRRSGVSIRRSYFGLEVSMRFKSFRFSARIKSVLSSGCICNCQQYLVDLFVVQRQ